MTAQNLTAQNSTARNLTAQNPTAQSETTPGSTAGPAQIGIVGGGWRAHTFVRIAQALPERFDLSAALVRSEAAADSLHEEWRIAVSTGIDGFLAGGPFDFVVLCVAPDATAGFIREFAGRGIPILVETPPSRELDELHTLYREFGDGSPIQVAEQYRFQPHHAARIAVANSGVLGTVTSARVSVAHEYHGMSLVRALLGIGFDPVEITAAAFDDRLVSTIERDGWVDEFEPIVSERVTARLAFPNRELLALYEFESEQYRSAIRSRHISAAGDRGEISDDSVRYVRSPGDVAITELARQQTGAGGDLEGHFLRSITLGERTVYTNDFAPARLTDDEIAIAELLERMRRFVFTGDELYGLADASHDMYLSILIAEASRTGHAVRSEPQPWDGAVSVLRRDRERADA